MGFLLPGAAQRGWFCPTAEALRLAGGTGGSWGWQEMQGPSHIPVGMQL